MTMMSSQNHRTNMNTAKTSVRKLRNVNPSDKKNMAASPFYWTDSLRASRAACAFFVACETLPIFAGGTRVRRPSLGRGRAPSLGGVARGLDVGPPRLELVHAADLLAHAFERRGEHLLAPQGGLGRARKACASLRPLSAHCTAICVRQGALLGAHLAQTQAQRPEIIKRSVINSGRVAA